MSQFVPVSSVYTFTENIRQFKANDPYYFEVDNIPIKQLQENTLWLKDQFNADTVTKVNREDFEELRPYVGGSDRVLKIKPGRFTARVNDAYSLTPLQRFVQVEGQNFGEVEAWKVFSSDDEALSGVLENFKTRVATNAHNMNGLAERAFTYPVVNSDFAATTYFKTNAPGTYGS